MAPHCVTLCHDCNVVTLIFFFAVLHFRLAVAVDAEEMCVVVKPRRVLPCGSCYAPLLGSATFLLVLLCLSHKDIM